MHCLVMRERGAIIFKRCVDQPKISCYRKEIFGVIDI